MLPPPLSLLDFFPFFVTFFSASLWEEVTKIKKLKTRANVRFSWNYQFFFLLKISSKCTIFTLINHISKKCWDHKKKFALEQNLTKLGMWHFLLRLLASLTPPPSLRNLCKNVLFNLGDPSPKLTGPWDLLTRIKYLLHPRLMKWGVPGRLMIFAIWRLRQC